MVVFSTPFVLLRLPRKKTRYTSYDSRNSFSWRLNRTYFSSRWVHHGRRRGRRSSWNFFINSESKIGMKCITQKQERVQMKKKLLESWRFHGIFLEFNHFKYSLFGSRIESYSILRWRITYEFSRGLKLTKNTQCWWSLKIKLNACNDQPVWELL